MCKAEVSSVFDPLSPWTALLVSRVLRRRTEDNSLGLHAGKLVSQMVSDVGSSALLKFQGK